MFELCRDWTKLNNEAVMLSVLGLIDMVMIANLTGMIIIGSYSTFVASLRLADDKRPQWLNGITSGMLKVKMSTSVIGVSLVALVITFVGVDTLPWDLILKKAFIHATFLVAVWSWQLSNSSAPRFISSIARSGTDKNMRISVATLLSLAVIVLLFGCRTHRHRQFAQLIHGKDGHIYCHPKGTQDYYEYYFDGAAYTDSSGPSRASSTSLPKGGSWSKASSSRTAKRKKRTSR